ncbi:MAG: AGE family epimerase/isomerase [Acidobacteria bacterium]|nr:AGE family epimerase/isomerase [Acidobacteriota bacterium]
MANTLLPCEELRRQYTSGLFDQYLPFLERHVVDHQHGGFLCHTTPFGRRVSTTKRIWFQGRGLWVYSFLYNNFARESRYLDIAARTVDLIRKSTPAGADESWPIDVDEAGLPSAPPDPEIYSDLFVAEGLAEFHKATGEEQYWQQSMEIVRKSVRRYDRPDYYPVIGETYFGPGARPFPGARILGVSMVFLRLAAQMLRMRHDAELQALADRALHAILEHHLNPRFGLLNELLNHDLSRPTNEYEQFVYAGHAIETLWMAMDEALRRQDRPLFERLAQLFRRHVELAWDRVYGGLFCNLRHVDNNQWVLQKVLFPQQEALIGLLMLVEHSKDAWAAARFAELNRWVHAKYPLTAHGSPIWQVAGNRFVDFIPDAERVENYHHPRFLMLNLLALKRL